MRAKSVLAVALAGFMTAGASAYVIGGFKGSAPVQLHQPQKPDSVQKENPFSADKLLKSRHFATQWPETAGWTTMVPDTAGNLVLVDSKNAPQLRTFASHLRAERFAKGKLKLVSAPRADVILNGDVKISKTTADSVPGEETAGIELLPQQDYSLIVNVLTMPDDPGKPEFRLEFVPDKDFESVKVSSGADMDRRVSPLSTMQGERVSSMALSPDGKYLLTRYREVISAEESRKRVVMTETATGHTVSENIDFSADWMPKSNGLFFTKEGVKDYDLYVMEVPSMRTTRIATAIPDQDVTFSPDEKYLFYYDKVDGAKQEGVMRRYTSPDDRIPGDRDRFYICRYDIENGVAVPLTYGGGTTSICDISRDGSKLLYMSQRQTPDKYPFYRVSLVQMDMNTFATDTIINDADGFVSNAIYSPDATRLFVVGGPDAFDRIGANHDPEPLANNFDNQGFIMTLSDRSVKPMTKDFDPSLEGTPVWNAVDNKIYFIGERGFFRDLYQLNPSDGKIVMLGKENLQTVRGFSIGDREDRYAAYWGGSFTDDGVACLLNLKNGKSTLVDDPLKEWLGDTQFGKMEPWKFTASDGTVVDGYMCLPPDFDANKKYPLIVYYYGGTSPSNASFYHLYSPQVFASRDYVVYVLNPSGTTGYGQEYSARHVNAWGKRTADEIIQGVKEFCKSHPFVNKDRIGCLGASYGGFMTQYLLTKTDIFHAAISHAGISNVTSYWGEGFWGYSYNSVAAAKSYPWTDPELFTKQGSLFNADKIHTPLLLLHGTVDTNVPIGESIQLFNALKILGRDVEFITVQDENHVISNFNNKLSWHNTIMAWFAKWLQDDPSWWNALYK
jgi:dipeptidyl aminopeptidase/acylaminoacyl peptidase